MNAFIDCHNHSLPYIDDGAKDIDMALKMLEIARSNGTEAIFLTPHHLNGAFINQKSDIIKQLENLKVAVKKASIDIQLFLGSEVHLVENSADEILQGKAMTFANKNKAALIELPKHNIPIGAEKVLSQLIYNGLTPIIAHPERNTYLRANISQLSEWIEMGCRSQLTAMSCEGKFGEEIKTASFQMINEGNVHIIASDAHRPEGRSPKLLGASEVIKESYGESAERLFFYENPKRLMNGEDLQHFVPEKLVKQKSKKRFLWF